MNDKFRFLKGKLLSGRVYLEFFPFNPNDRVVNLGCGEGPQAIVYAGKYREMVGIDINKDRLRKSHETMRIYNVQDYATLCANVEKIPLLSFSFDKAIAIDIIEHVQNPRNLCLEANRLLSVNGKLLITFPVMHDKFTRVVSKVGRFISKRKKERKHSCGWDPDSHNQANSLRQWIRIVESYGFKFLKSRASTLFPPLHLYGVPRFWFSNNIIHKIDSFFCRMPVLKNCGQASICIFGKKKNFSQNLQNQWDFNS